MKKSFYIFIIFIIIILLPAGRYYNGVLYQVLQV